MWLDKLTERTRAFDDDLRQSDFDAQRTAGGYLDRRYKIRRHTVWALLFPAAACFFALLGSPNLPRLLWALAGAAAVYFLLIRRTAANEQHGRPLRADLHLQLGIVSAVVLAIWLLAPSQYSDWFPYRSLVLPLTLAVSVTLFAAGFLAESLCRGLRANANGHAALRRTELFAARGEVIPITLPALLAALCLVPFRAPLQLLLPAALVALISQPAVLNQNVLAVVAICYAALTLSGLNERFGMMWSLLNHSLLEGGALLVSIVVIALAAARFLGVTYVTTLFDTAAGWVVSAILLSIYVLSWWFTYWTNRLLTDQWIRLLSPSAASGEVSIPYPIAPESVATSVPAGGRVLQIHGSSRFIAIRECGAEDPVPCFFQSYPALDLLHVLSIAGAPGGRAVPTFLQLQGRAFTFHGLTATLLAAILIAAGFWIHGGVQDAELETELSAGGGISPASLLAKPADDRTLYVLAASGGGTRAALFTTAILEGIASRKKGGDVVLASGVSGGGAALAYHAGHRAALVGYDNPAAWRNFYDAMKAPYIRDVLERASEWRMIDSGRLGMLLRESFARRWGLSESASALDRCGSPSSGDGCAFGLLLNTTLAGHLHLDAPPPPGTPLSAVEPAVRDNTSSSAAGGRLVLTNLALPSGFAGRGVEPDGRDIPILVRGPAVTLQHAAALNANFPPVFANAAIDVNRQDRYWVTDGGTADNRGMEMLLIAVLQVLETMRPDERPKLHIVVADASAYSAGFAQDRGISSALGAGAQFAGALDARLKSAIEALYAKDSGRLQFSYVFMPRPLRASGAFGTHWMLQDRITVRPDGVVPRFADKVRDWLLPSSLGWGSGKEVTIGGGDMIDLLRVLYVRDPLSLDAGRAGKPLTLGPDACKVLRWARVGAPVEQSGPQWSQVVRALGGDAPAAAPPCP